MCWPAWLDGRRRCCCARWVRRRVLRLWRHGSGWRRALCPSTSPRWPPPGCCPGNGPGGVCSTGAARLAMSWCPPRRKVGCRTDPKGPTMQFVHYGHSCVLAETGDTRLLFDPGNFSQGFEDVRELTAILITHQHPDHLDPQRLPALLAANPGAELITDPASAETVAALGLTARVVRPGETFTVGS